MRDYPKPLDLRRVRVYPLATRASLSPLEKMLVNPEGEPPACTPAQGAAIEECIRKVREARERGAAVILMYGAHLVKNGAMSIVIRLLEGEWVTHLATNGAGVIHDWELAFLGRTEESVRKHVAAGCFGTWDETSRSIHLAVLAGALENRGYGQSLGRFILEDGVTLPSVAELEAALRAEPAHPLSPARAELLQTMISLGIPGGRTAVLHPNKASCIVAQAFSRRIPFTVHPGIGYDIITNHPIFSGAALGRAAAMDFRLFGASVDRLDGGVVLSVGSAIMAPQVFEKSLSCVNNLRLQDQRHVVRDHTIFVVDIQDGGNWDWSTGEPPKTNPAYYLRFCKSFARMGGTMRYAQCDNVVFLHRLLKGLSRTTR